MKLDRLVDGITPRLVGLAVLVLIPILALVGRMWYEQVRLGEAHRAVISSQSIRKVRIPAVRGRIMDRDGIKIADNAPSYDILFHVHEMRQPGRDSRRRTLEHVVEQIHHVELQVGRPSDTALKWAATPPEIANDNPKIPGNRKRIAIADVLNWHGVVVRTKSDNAKWGWSPFTNDKTELAIDLKANRFHCVDTGIRGGPVEFAAFMNPLVPDDQIVPILAERMNLLRHVRQTPALPYEAFTNLTSDQLGRVLGRFPGIKGMEVVPRFSRMYPHKEIAGHMVGSTGRRRSRDLAIAEAEQRSFAVDVLGLKPDASDDDLKNENLAAKVFFKPELAGQSGLEYRFDESLRGKPGSQFIRVNSIGFLYGESGPKIEPQHGSDLHLTVSMRAQTIAQRLLGDQMGAVVVMECNTGAILTLASSPAFDPANFQQDYNSLVADERNPLFNRALRADYFPGSIVKPLILAMALERGITQPEDLLVCPKYYKLGSRKIACSHSHEPVDAVSALKHSCNTYFIDLGMKMGPDPMGPFLETVGFGRDLGFELPPPPSGARRYGVRPDPELFKRLEKRNWSDHETANASIGQGFFKCSPLQAAVMTAALANGGRVWRPYVVSDVRNSDGAIVEATRREIYANLPISSKSIKVIHEGMAAVVWGAHGTGSNARSNVFPMAGKTGTAEAGPRNSGKKHTWFIGYGPIGAPTHAIVVMIENGRSGGKSAAPIAKQFFEEYFADKAVGALGN